MKIVTVIGARPQIIKAAALSRAIRNSFSEQIVEIIVHTGQHYDENMSKVFFDELNIPLPNYNLNVGSGKHGMQTAKMIEGLEEIFIKEQPDFVVLYGDTNSTLAGAIAASKLHIKIAHIEAGLRSYNKAMPEEINRIMCDHASTLLFSPTYAGIENLLKEGFSDNSTPPFTNDNPKIYHCGDVMYDNSLYFSKIAEKSAIMEANGLTKNNFILATIHRDSNTDDSLRLSAIFDALNEISRNNSLNIILPLHPRTKKLLEINLSKELFDSISNNPYFKVISAVSFIEMIQLEKNAKLIITDSGGVQKEAFFFEKPCVILRPETEWVELVEMGTAILADADKKRIIDAFDLLINKNSLQFLPIFGDGKASEFICTEIVKCTEK
ncbi:MAG: UDP-N-acetylglucosamine 2-epimerase (non-hydrolyzing) [Bacteroidota bacterium]